MSKQDYEDPRITVKILRSLHEKTKAFVEKSGSYSTESDLYNEAIRDKLRAMGVRL